ncbi:MAG: cobalamin-binding protein, partial [Acidobacteria bacterium CG_4_9_14_3_um_filter_49_7]
MLNRFRWIACLSLLICLQGMAGGIVSLLPSVTDMVVDLGSANRLTGITRYGVVPEGV